MSHAISAALVVLGFFEMPEEDVPDSSIWGHPKRLEDWFEAVKQRRLHPGMEPITDDESSGMMRNELADELRTG